jgi:hypothetical protein
LPGSNPRITARSKAQKEKLISQVLDMSRHPGKIEEARKGSKLDKQLARLASVTRKDYAVLSDYFCRGRGVALFVNGNLESKEYGASKFVTFPLSHTDPPRPGDLMGADSVIGDGKDVMCVSVIADETEVEEFIRTRLINFL